MVDSLSITANAKLGTPNEETKISADRSYKPIKIIRTFNACELETEYTMKTFRFFFQSKLSKTIVQLMSIELVNKVIPP